VWRAGAALVLLAAGALPVRADYESNNVKDATQQPSSGLLDASTKTALRTGRLSSNLRWRTPAADSKAPAELDAKQVAEARPIEKQPEKPAAEKPAEATPPQAPSSSKNPFAPKSIVKVSAVKEVDKDEPSGPARAKAKAASAPESGAKQAALPKRPRAKVERLSDAGPSPFSSGAADPGGSSLKIIKASNEEPKIDPFGEDEPKLRPTNPRPSRRTIQAGLQERRGGAARDPFGEQAPELERVPGIRPPEQPEELTQGPGPRAMPYACPNPSEYVKRLSDISTNIAAEPGEFPVECGLGDEPFQPRDFHGTVIAWKASALCHKPLYFEDVELERYGQTCSPLFQPLLSAAKFYLTLPILPYKFGLEPPCECIYPLGYYRPGSCAPFIIPPLPISLRGALLEAGVWVAGVALVP
jgi:hypothetical protein